VERQKEWRILSKTCGCQVPVDSSFNSSVSSSYGIDMLALTGTSRKGSKIEILLSGKSGQGEQARSAGADWRNVGLM
jgi:hypothetical protein